MLIEHELAPYQNAEPQILTPQFSRGITDKSRNFSEPSPPCLGSGVVTERTEAWRVCKTWDIVLNTECLLSHTQVTANTVYHFHDCRVLGQPMLL